MLRAIPTFVIALAAALFALAPRAAAEGASSHKRTTTSATFIEFSGLASAVVDGVRPAGVMQVEFGLEVPDHDLHELALRIQPRLQALCAEALRAYAGDMYLLGSPPDADMIASLIKDRVDEALGREGAQVVLAMVIVHRNR